MDSRKSELRKKLQEGIKGLSEQQRKDESKAMAEGFSSLPEWSRSRDVLLFLSMPGEIDTKGIVQTAVSEKKRVWAPRIQGEEMEFYLISRGGADPYLDLEYNSYGIWEPRDTVPLFSPEKFLSTDENGLCVIATPGLGFDRRGHRLGRGKGYYDKWLSRYPLLMKDRRMVPVGIGFSVQLLDTIPSEPHDILLPQLIIGGRYIQCEPAE